MHDTLTLPLFVLHRSLVQLAVREEDLDLDGSITVRELPALEARLDDFIWSAEKDALTLRSTLSPLTLIYGPVRELADARAVAQVVLPVALVDVATG